MIFQHRQVDGHKPPLKPGTYKMQNDFYSVDREPRIGELCAEYAAYSKQCGTLIKTTYETVRIE